MPLKLTITANKIQKLAHDNGCLSLMEEHKAELFLKDNSGFIVMELNEHIEQIIMNIMADRYSDA